MSERWRRIEQLCHEALARKPGDRAAFLEQACAGDTGLRREVESLVAQQSAAGGFLEPPAPSHAPSAAASDVQGFSLAAGTRMGPYEITACLGAGGMGEVYKARDTRLGRTVAIKVLSPAFARDSNGRRRFEHEARAVSALNHPNICTLHDIGSAAVAGGQGETIPIDYLVMEFVQGRTLAEAVGRGPLPLAEALEYGAQIADALGKAHRHGIVHRDLKPANIMLTKSGIKLLDFGLAKLKPAAPAGVTGRLSAVSTAPPTTTPGLVLGTVPYMAPEQLEGKETDARSDIFSFGCVLYEMLTARRAFPGESEASVISAIMSSQPPPISSLQPVAPPLLDRLVQRCLAKDPDDRAESARDVAFELRSIGAGDAAQVPQSTARPSRRRVGQTAAAVAVLLVGLGLGWLGWHGDRSLPSFRRLTFRRGVVYGARFTADGQNILFAAGWDGEPRQVFSTRYDSVDATLREGLQGMDVLALSRSNELALLRGDTLARGPLAGGAPHDVVAGITSADWNPDGSQLAVTRATTAGYPISRTVEYPIGTVIYTTQRMVNGVRVSPRGDLLAFLDHSDGHGRVVVIDTAGHKKVESAYHDGLDYPVWTADGREVWFSISVPHAKISAVALDLSGHERNVLTDPIFRIKDISRDGRVLLATDDPLYGISGRGSGSASERNLTWYNWSMLDDMSSDGRIIVFSDGGLSDNQNQWNTFVRSTDGSPPQRFEGIIYSRLSPDGKWLAGLDANTTPSQVRVVPTGAGEGRVLTKEDVPHRVLGWLPDSSGVVYWARNRVMLAMLDGRPPTPITPEGWTSPGMGPDGRHVLAVPSESTTGGARMFLYSIDGSEKVPLPGFDPAKWMPIGWEPGGTRMRVVPRAVVGAGVLRVFLLDPMNGDARPWKELGGQLDRAGLTSIGDGGRVHFSADGESYAYSYRRRLSTLYTAEGLR